MNNNNKINSLQLGSMLLALSITTFLGIGIFDIIKAAGVDAYLSVFVGSVVGIILFLLFLYIANYEPELSICEKTKKLFGPIFGTILNILLCISAFILGTTVFYNLINFTVSQFLSETPFTVIGIVFAFIIAFINIKGIETLSRTSLVLISINVILFLVCIFGIFPTFELENLKPFLANGLSNPLKGMIYMLALNVVPIFLLLIIPKNSIEDKKHYNKYLFVAYLFGCLVMITAILLTVGSLGIYLASYYQYPEYMVLKRIDIFDFIDRIENLIILQWFFGAFISMSVTVFFISKNIKLKKEKINKLVPVIITILLLITSLTVFPNNTVYNNFSYKYAIYPRFLTLLIEIIIGVAIIIKKRIKKT